MARIGIHIHGPVVVSHLRHDDGHSVSVTSVFLRPAPEMDDELSLFFDSVGDLRVYVDQLAQAVSELTPPHEPDVVREVNGYLAGFEREPTELMQTP